MDTIFSIPLSYRLSRIGSRLREPCAKAGCENGWEATAASGTLNPAGGLSPMSCCRRGPAWVSGRLPASRIDVGPATPPQARMHLFSVRAARCNGILAPPRRISSQRSGTSLASSTSKASLPMQSPPWRPSSESQGTDGGVLSMLPGIVAKNRSLRPPDELRARGARPLVAPLRRETDPTSRFEPS